MPDFVTGSMPTDARLADSLLEITDFAWEILRRNPAYGAAVSVREAPRRIAPGVIVLNASTRAAPWGLQFRGEPGHSERASGTVLASAP